MARQALRKLFDEHLRFTPTTRAGKKHLGISETHLGRVGRPGYREPPPAQTYFLLAGGGGGGGGAGLTTVEAGLFNPCVDGF